MYVFSICKAFFYSVTQVAWGLVSLFGFNLIISYILISKGAEMPITISKTFLILEQVIINNMMFFVSVFFVLGLYFEIKEINK